MRERGVTSAANEAHQEEPTVVGPEKRGLKLRLVREQELRAETTTERLFVGAGASLKKAEGSKPNEDAWGLDANVGLALVADGFGGYAEGEKASAAAVQAMKMAVRRELEEPFLLSLAQQERNAEVDPELKKARQFVEKTLRLDPSRFASADDVERALRQGLVSANQAVIKEARGGGTTISAAIVHETWDGKRRVKFINRGDSRVYLYRKGILRQLTKDDSLVEQLRAEQLLADDEDVDAELSKAALRYLREINPSGAKDGNYAIGTTLGDIRNVVTKGLSVVDRQVEKTPVGEVDLEEGDLLIQATDGVIDNLTRDQTAAIVQQNTGRHPQDVANELVNESKAIARSSAPRAKADDATATVERIESGRSLRVILEAKLDEWSDALQARQDPEVLEKGEMRQLYAIRNQLEFAVEGHRGNDKLAALRDHVLSRLRSLDSRVRELRTEGAIASPDKRLSKTG